VVARYFLLAYMVSEDVRHGHPENRVIRAHVPAFVRIRAQIEDVNMAPPKQRLEIRASYRELTFVWEFRNNRRAIPVCGQSGDERAQGGALETFGTCDIQEFTEGRKYIYMADRNADTSCSRPMAVRNANDDRR
jgi:hypothetical protein